MRLHAWIDRPNLYVKIPATKPGLGGDRGLHRAGADHQRDADLLAPALPRRRRGVPARARAARRLGRRPRRRALGRELLRLPRRHRGRPAARGDRRRTRRSRASSPSRTRSSPTSTTSRRSPATAGSSSTARARARSACLWASTSTKNPAYRDVLYVEELIGPDDGEHDAARRRSAPSRTTARSRDTLAEGVDEAHALLDELAAAGVDYDDVAETLEVEGVQKFADSFDELREGIAEKLARRRGRVVPPAANPLRGGPGRPAPAGSLRARRLRGVGRPHEAQAAARALLARLPRAAAGAVRRRRRRAHASRRRGGSASAMRGGGASSSRATRSAPTCGSRSPPGCATSRPTSPTTAARTASAEVLDELDADARHGRQPRSTTSPSRRRRSRRSSREIGQRREREGWARLIIEKPFGHDLASARELNAP